jgi:hypothetical protein
VNILFEEILQMSARQKYRLLPDETKVVDGVTLHRIVAERDVGDTEEPIAEKGEKGGFVESERNLSQRGGSWIDEGAIAMGRSRIYGEAILRSGVIVRDAAKVGADHYFTLAGNVVVSGHAKLLGASVWNESKGTVEITGNTTLEQQDLDINYRGPGTLFITNSPPTRPRATGRANGPKRGNG